VRDSGRQWEILGVPFPWGFRRPAGIDPAVIVVGVRHRRLRIDLDQRDRAPFMASFLYYKKETCMTNMMKAALVRELGKPLTIEEVPVPEPGPDQILVRIAATGVCHTDLHAVKGDWPWCLSFLAMKGSVLWSASVGR
jgi:Alcohol dehydrogenase GroES-like domain